MSNKTASDLVGKIPSPQYAKHSSRRAFLRAAITLPAGAMLAGCIAPIATPSAPAAPAADSAETSTAVPETMTS